MQFELREEKGAVDRCNALGLPEDYCFLLAL